MATKTMKIGLSNADKNTMSGQVALETINKLIDTYSTSKQYAVGDYVNNAGIIYVCIEATSGAWNSTKWSVATLNQVIDKVNQAANSVENKAEKDGYYETFGYAREAGIAKNLQNDEGKLLDPDADTSSGTTYADQPFSQRATAMTMKAYLDNELITVGSGYEQWKKEQAFSIVRNQLLSNVPSTFTESGITFTKVDNYTFTISGIATNRVSAKINTSVISVALGHKYLICGMEKNNQNIGLIFNGYKDNFDNYITTYSGRDIGEGIIINNSNTNVNKLAVELVIDNGTELSKTYTVKPKVIDLTQWFASKPEIATALNGDAGIKWFLQNYPEALTLDSDEGTIVDTEDYEYQTTGVNLWDEEWELGIYSSKTGEKLDESTQIRSKNAIAVLPNTQYYLYVGSNVSTICLFYDTDNNLITNVEDDNNYMIVRNMVFTTPSNAHSMRFYMLVSYGTTYKNDIQICHHFTETSVEQTYHKYEIFKDRVSWAFTSTGKGKSAGSVADTKDYVNKKNIEKVGRVDLGTLNWNYDNSTPRFYQSVPDIKPLTTNILSAIYKYGSPWASLDSDMDIYVNESGTVSIKNKSYTDPATFKAAMSGVYLYYELATPIETDMQGDEYDTNIPENDYGVERKVSVSGNMFSGSATTIFYQDNVLRQIYNNKGSIDNIQVDVDTLEVRIPVAPTTDGTYTLKAVVSNGVATYSWTLDSQGE